MMMMCEPGPSSQGPRPVIENLDRFSVHELEQMRERQMRIVNRPRRVAAPPSDEAERRRARQKVETIELRLTALRAEEEMSNPRDQTIEIINQLDLMNVGKPVQVELKVKSKLSTRPYGMVANEPHSPTSPNGHVQCRPAMSEQEALQIQREAYALATAKKEADEQRRALHAQATNTRGIDEEEKRRRILAYMSYAGESDDEDEDMDDDEDGDGLFEEYEDDEFELDMEADELDMEADEYGLGGIIRVDPGRYANFGD